MAKSFARAASLGVASTLLLIGTLCVLDATMSSRAHVAESQPIADDLIGTGLLKAQANALNEQRHLASRGMDVESVDNMLHKFQEPSDNFDSLTQDLEKQAPKKDDLEMELIPDAAGVMHYADPTVMQKAAPSGLFEDEFSEDTMFVQDWTPAGQTGLSGQINEMKAADEEASLKEDSLLGHGVFSAIGIKEEEDPMETIFVQEEAYWEPQGQSGIAKDIQTAKVKDENDEADEEEIHGDSILSAVGIKEKEDPLSYDDLTNEDLGLVQVAATSGDWVPQGQPGLAHQMASAKDEDEESEMKEDGLKGHGMLSAAGVSNDEDEETEFLQQDAVAGWKPKGQSVKVKKSYTESRSQTMEDEENKYDHYSDGIEGNDIFSAVGMSDHLKPIDEVGDLGTLREEDLDLDLV